MPKDSSSLTTELKKLTQGLTYMSEADYPIKPFSMKGNGKKSLTADEMVRHSGKKPARKSKLDEFFNPVTEEQDWYGPEEHKTMMRFQELVKTLKENLTDIQVFKVGKVEMDVYVVGKTVDGDFVGVSTTVVET